MKPHIRQLCDSCRETCKQPEGAIVLRCGWYTAKMPRGDAHQNAHKATRSDQTAKQVGDFGLERDGDSREATGGGDT